MKKFFVTNSFLLGIVAAIVLAAIFPNIGSSESPLPVGMLKKIGIFGIFFFQGLSLPFNELRRGFSDWHLHFCIQVTTFVFFPLVVLVGLFITSGFFTQPDLRAGFLYLSFLPTTISSALALAILAQGNISGALFNTTLSNVAGVFLVPIFCIFLLNVDGSGESIALGPVLLGIFITILLPIIIGQLCRPLLKELAKKHKAAIRRFNSGVILFIIYAAFCDSFTGNIWSNVPTPSLVISLIGTVLLLAVSSGFVWWFSAALHLDRPSQVTALLCGSQKTLAVGLPLSAIIFGTEQQEIQLSLLIVPLLIYHPAQLILGGWLVPRLSRFVAHKEPRKTIS